jgi:hypothetical protein
LPRCAVFVCIGADVFVCAQDDFEQFAWTIVFLAMGGIALGKGVTQSGLLEVLDGIIRDLLDGVSPYNVVLILSPVVLVRRHGFFQCTTLTLTGDSGDLDFHQPHHRERAPRTHREGGGVQPAWEPRESPDLHNGADLLYRDGHACVGLPEPDSVCGAGRWRVFVFTIHVG